MKTMNLKVLAAGIVLAAMATTSLASAYGGGPGYGPGGPGAPMPAPGYGPGYDRGGGPGYDRGGPDYGRGGRDDRGGYDRGGRDDRGRGPGRPGPGPGRPGPGPGPIQDLCSGRYVGSYSNGFSAVIDFSHGYGDNINVNVLLNNQPLSGYGTCRQYGDRAQWEFTTMGVLNRGDIYRGYMSGGQPGGASLSANKQY